MKEVFRLGAGEMMSKILMISPKKCTGCKTCEVICSFSKTNSFNPKNAAVTVHDYAEVGIAVPMMCMQCENAACKNICPVKAISQTKDGVTLVDHDKCIGCKMCVSACPFGNMSFNSETRKVTKCDLCDGRPQCAEFCPSAAITYVEATGLNIEKKKELAKRFKQFAEEEVKI